MFIITGPTSSGKTSLALKICSQIDAEIVSADSRQIYKYFDVGTGKSPINSHDFKIEKHADFWQVNGVKIWMYDVCEPTQFFSILDYKQKTTKIIEDIQNRKKIPLIVGGTGFYIDAILGVEVASAAVPDWPLRDKLAQKSVTELLQLLPSEIIANINESDIHNPRRLIRKIEAFNQGIDLYAKQKPIDSNQLPRGKPSGYAVLNFGNLKSPQAVGYFDPKIQNNMLIVKRERADIYNRVDFWIDNIWPELLKEIKDLQIKGYDQTIPMQGIIYKTALAYLNGQISNENEALQLIKYDLHHYIRRQETWFKKYESAKIIDLVDKNFDYEVLKIVELIKNYEKNKSR